MCGFAGEFLLAPGHLHDQTLRRMGERLQHRGPDETGLFLCPTGRCGLAFQRLCIIDPAGSRQPMTTPDGRYTLAFNGEIYNYRELRSHLAAGGARFHTAGDTEVLLHLLVRRGAEGLKDACGMFALALYDRQEGRLLLARDRLGQKPLWYARTPTGLAFASEAKALLARDDVCKERDDTSIYLYCSIGYIPAPRSAWQGLRKLPPGHFVVLSALHASSSVSTHAHSPANPAAAPDASAPPSPASARDLAPAIGASRSDLDLPHPPQPYWRPPTATALPEGDAVQVVRDHVLRSIEARMVADVPLGALLSGGIDSAIVTAGMALAAGRSGGVRTFTAGFDDPEFDERPAARQVANHCRTEHSELLIRPDPAGMVDRILDMTDEPFADSSLLPTWLICREARQHVTVALGGDGGDECFAGYDRYRAMHLGETMGPTRYALVRLAALLARPFAPVHERSRLRRLIRFADALHLPPATQYLRYRALFPPEVLPRLFTEDFLNDRLPQLPADWFARLYEQGDFDDEVAFAQRHDLLTYLPDDLLVKTDIASMACSLELRAPFLDHHVVELGLSLPVRYKIHGHHGKHILQKAFGHLLPEDLWHRKKRGFGVPLGRWLRQELARETCETLLDPALNAMGIFREDAIAGLLNDHMTGQHDHRHRIWALLVLARWLLTN